ncbi:hypothetical protein BAUCODRAFT_340749 [Baudoinia panamericana UAMH 10762]|uniref:Uncharacterized protein n=1 Tax=Baudoinia panamericana (strain UAMH 10762) TaxID=717646 RepID=M2LXY8_BAUPA|nr:uncharacterized protein BAUCODRAFT_340749 [Baudoinia panamericana UAMH 10762]EMC99552.1 hypothetical protein BAUCODRAFT_340749 [Baudoinia panamericana UAMH 10762]
MPSRAGRPSRPAMYNTPHIRNGGFGALQVEAITNRPLSIARRHLAASQLRMRDIEPDELSSSEWVRFLVMQENERERWMAEFRRRRRNSDESSSSSADADNDADVAYDKAEEARQEAEEARRVERAERSTAVGETSSRSTAAPVGTTPPVSLWVRQFDEDEERRARGRPTSPVYSAMRPMHLRRAVTDGIVEAPPTYESAVRARTPPPAYVPREDDGSR